MEIAIIVLGVILIVIGFVGSIIPALPGPPLAYGGVLLLLFIDTAKSTMSANGYLGLIALGIITLVITLIDYYMPIWGTKKYGGTPAGTRGSTVGLIIAALLTIFTAGIGFIALLLGPLVGAYVGEKNSGQTHEVALRSAKGSFLGFLAGTFMKIVIVIIIAVYFARVLL